MEKHFKLRKDLTIEAYGITLFRIEATRDIEVRSVKKGDLGGYIEKEENLSENAWVYGDARVYGDAMVSGDAWVYGSAWVSGSACVSGDAWVKKTDDCRNIINDKYNITILPESIQIGCQLHTKKEWWGFSDREIIEMDGKDGLKWWNKWKPIFMAICEEHQEVEK